jgi:hypothetical protein
LFVYDEGDQESDGLEKFSRKFLSKVPQSETKSPTVGENFLENFLKALHGPGCRVLPLAPDRGFARLREHVARAKVPQLRLNCRTKGQVFRNICNLRFAIWFFLLNFATVYKQIIIFGYVLMTKDELISIFHLIEERDWSPLYKEGCERLKRNPSNGYLWVQIHADGLLWCNSCMPKLILFETIKHTHDDYGRPLPEKDWDAIAEPLESLDVILLQAVENKRSDDYLAASGEPEYWKFELGTVTYYPNGTCSEIEWV